MKDRIFSVLQRVGRSFMLPIAILPVAGLLLGIGSSFTNATTIETYGLTAVLGEGTILHALLVIMNKVGSAVFDNLPLIFAVGVAIGMAKKEKEVSALSAVISYFVMNTAINAMLTINGQILDNGEIAESVLEGTITSVCGIQSLQMGCFRRYYRRTGSGGSPQPVLQDPASECPVLLRRDKVCTDYFHYCLYVCGNPDVFCMAGGTEWYLRAGRSCHRLRICGNPDLRPY